MEKTFKDLAYCAEQSWVREADSKKEGNIAGGICINLPSQNYLNFFFLHQLRETAISFLCPKCKRFCSLLEECSFYFVTNWYSSFNSQIQRQTFLRFLLWPLPTARHSHLFIFIAFAFFKKHMPISMYLTYVLKFHLISYMFGHVFSLVGLSLHSQLYV